MSRWKDPHHKLRTERQAYAGRLLAALKLSRTEYLTVPYTARQAAGLAVGYSGAAEEALRRGEPVAIPGLYVRGTYWEVRRLSGGRVSIRVRRKPGSYAHESQRSQVTAHDKVSPLLDRAEQAGRKFEPLLVDDTWQGVPVFVLRHPERRDSHPAFARRDAQLVVAALSSAPFWVDDDGHQALPSPHELAESLGDISCNPIRIWEWTGSMRLQQVSVCAICGAPALDVSCVKGCTVALPPSDLTNPGMYSVPWQVFEYLQGGRHPFLGDPTRWSRE